jgi:hypothetical protein
MDHQGSGRTRSAADTRGQAPWPRLGNPEGAGPAGAAGDYDDPEDTETFARPVFGYDSGAQPVLGAGSGAHPVLRPGSGAQPVLGAGTGPQWAAESGGRTPVRGFPPGRAPGEPPPDVYSPWHTPGEPLTGPAAGEAAASAHGDDGAYGDDTDRFARIEPARVPAGRRRSAKEKPKRRLLSRTVLLATTTVVVVAAAGFAGYKYLYEPRVNAPVSPSLRLPTSAPGSPDADQAHGNKWQHIAARTGDPAPLTIVQLYPPQFVLGNSSYARTAASITKNCSSAVYGANLQAALQSGHCTQAVRASYISGNGQMMGTVGVVNLSTVAAAGKAGQASGPDEIIVPLAAKKGATSKLGSGTGVVQAEIKGHYLILMWAEFADLKSPPTAAARQLLEQFAADLVTGTANIDLSTRLLSGKP